jgi:HK97 family phage major capsid protein
MPSTKRQILQDEAAELATEIEALRSVEPATDEEAAEVAARLDEKTTRAHEVSELAARERELDAKVEALRQVVKSDSEPRSQVEDRTETTEAKIFPAFSGQGFRSTKEAEIAGRALRALARGDVRELRAMDTGSAGSGGELVIPELFNGFIDVLGYSSVGVQVASLFPTSSNSLTIPKIGEIEASFFDEAGTITDDDATTDDVEIALHKIGRLIKISNELAEDVAAGVALAQTIANRLGLAIAKKIDSVWLQGDAGKSITGLVDAIAAGNTVEQGTSNDATDLADMVGLIDYRAGNTAWVVSSAGWSHILKASVVTQSTTVGGRVLPVVMGAPVYHCLGLPAGTLALYGDFSAATAVAYKANGLQIAASTDAAFATDQVVYRGTQRVGISNHDASFVAKLVVPAEE